jgi:hypothetical protein
VVNRKEVQWRVRLLSTLKKELIHPHTFHTHEACKSPCLSSLRSSQSTAASSELGYVSPVQLRLHLTHMQPEREVSVLIAHASPSESARTHDDKAARQIVSGFDTRVATAIGRVFRALAGYRIQITPLDCCDCA